MLQAALNAATYPGGKILFKQLNYSNYLSNVPKQAPAPDISLCLSANYQTPAISLGA